MKKLIITKEVSLKKVSPMYRPIIDIIICELLKYSSHIHSIYLYGSVATGKAQSPTSDLDLIVILHVEPSQKVAEQFNSVQLILSNKYKNLFREVGILITHKKEVTCGKESYGWRFFFTILSVKIHGNDLFDNTINFSPTKKLAKNLNSDITSEIDLALKRISLSEGEKSILLIKQIMKKLIRTAFSIIMEKENYWTSDLNEMARIFIKYYPEKSQEINIVLHLINSDSPDKAQACSIINNFGSWLSNEFFNEITIDYNSVSELK